MYSSHLVSDTKLHLKKTVDAHYGVPIPNIPDFISNHKTISVDVDTFIKKINLVYNTVVHWRRNLFQVPKSKVGRDFVNELTEWLQHFNEGTVYEPIAIKVFAIVAKAFIKKQEFRTRRTS